MNPESDSNVLASPSYRQFEEICGVDGFLVRTRISCEDPSSIPEVFPLPSPSDSLSEEDEGVVLGPGRSLQLIDPVILAIWTGSSWTGWSWCQRRLRMKHRVPLVKSSFL